MPSFLTHEWRERLPLPYNTYCIATDLAKYTAYGFVAGVALPWFSAREGAIMAACAAPLTTFSWRAASNVMGPQKLDKLQDAINATQQDGADNENIWKEQLQPIVADFLHAWGIAGTVMLVSPALARLRGYEMSVNKVFQFHLSTWIIVPLALAVPRKVANGLMDQAAFPSPWWRSHGIRELLTRESSPYPEVNAKLNLDHLKVVPKKVELHELSEVSDEALCDLATEHFGDNHAITHLIRKVANEAVGKAENAAYAQLRSTLKNLYQDFSVKTKDEQNAFFIQLKDAFGHCEGQWLEVTTRALRRLRTGQADIETDTLLFNCELRDQLLEAPRTFERFFPEVNSNIHGVHRKGQLKIALRELVGFDMPTDDPDALYRASNGKDYPDTVVEWRKENVDPYLDQFKAAFLREYTPAYLVEQNLQRWNSMTGNCHPRLREYFVEKKGEQHVDKHFYDDDYKYTREAMVFLLQCTGDLLPN